MESHVPSASPETGRDPGLKITVIGGIVNLVLTGIKFLAGIAGGSSVLVVDAIHSLSDLATDIVAFAGRRWALLPQDRDHPYGHGRIETLAALIMGLFLIGLAVYFAVDSVQKFLHPRAELPGYITLAAALISIISKEVLYRSTVRVGKEMHSGLIIANAWHHRSDALSSVVAFLGILFARLGTPAMDPLAALIVVLMVGHAGFAIFLDAFRNLADTMVEEALQEQIRASLSRVAGVRDFHDFRARRVGSEVWVDVHLQVPSEISVSEGHYIAERARRMVLQDIPEVREVLVHIDPEGGSDRGEPLMDRERLREEMNRALKGVIRLDTVEHVTIDYREGGIDLTLRLLQPAALTLGEADYLGERVRQCLLGLEGVRTVQVNYSPGSTP
ncbi:MAG TPA: cation diffusion facilitator family transporter [Thermoanaerobaculia bacterium]|nr:cation diffusion facilitator family transporter [Thermoanaerobaculia bacterium]HUM28691.1 cation diffusion facilitator family transporter [Thermoanaerobaculia bacterium]HXK66701.1 cation diffusion facilitator family transporter [Thermoanaerobaculia bacterium]